MKFVMCGLWHVHAEGYCATAAKYGEIVGVYEPDRARREAFCQKTGYMPLETVEQMTLCGADAAIVTAATSEHTELILALIEAGMDVFTEKVLALTSEECLRIAEAVRRKGVRFAISFPHLCNGGIRALKALCDSGELGKINYLRYRNVHTGASRDWLPPHFYSSKECGGGAMIDLGAHGMYVAHWILGLPVSAKSAFTRACTNPSANEKNADGVEDNAVTVMTYESGAIAINETGFVSEGYPMILEIGGEDGWAEWRGEHAYKTVNGKREEVPFLPSLPSPLDSFCMGGESDEWGIDAALALTRMMELAYGD